MIIAVDFDGTIVENAYPGIGTEVPGILDGLRILQIEGAFIILWTCRHSERLEEAVVWLKERGFIPNAINTNHPLIVARLGDSRKVYANIYLDDSAVYSSIVKWDRFTSTVLKWMSREGGPH